MTERQVSVLLRLCRLVYWTVSDLARYLVGKSWGLFRTGVALGTWAGMTYGLLDLFSRDEPPEPLFIQIPIALILGAIPGVFVNALVWNPLLGWIEATIESPRLKAPTPLERKFLKKPETDEGGRLTIHED